MYLLYYIMMFHFSYPFFVKRLDTCIMRFINVIYDYYLFIVKRFDHIIGKRYISTCYVCMYVCMLIASQRALYTCVKNVLKYTTCIV